MRRGYTMMVSDGSTGVCSSDLGTATVNLSATNGGGTGTATLTLTITAGAPVITSGTTASGTEGRAFSHQITATITPTRFLATKLAAGFAVNTSTGLVIGSPTSAGTATVNLRATNLR